MNSITIPQARLLPSNSVPKRAPTNSKIPSICNCFNLCNQEEVTSNSRYGVVLPRLRSLVTEFRSLPEPMDRVKRLLDRAAAAPRLGGGLSRSAENRVAGCAAQVWVGVEMDEFGRMRFRADSDSEITKGFSSCLVYLLDGASPEEVLMVKAEDLMDMNVGLPTRSRVNSWHNVLTNMQDRTKSIILLREGLRS